MDSTPEQKGPFSIETFVWNENNALFGAQGSFVLKLVN